MKKVGDCDIRSGGCRILTKATFVTKKNKALVYLVAGIELLQPVRRDAIRAVKYCIPIVPRAAPHQHRQQETQQGYIIHWIRRRDLPDLVGFGERGPDGDSVGVAVGVEDGDPVFLQEIEVHVFSPGVGRHCVCLRVVPG